MQDGVSTLLVAAAAAATAAQQQSVPLISHLANKALDYASESDERGGRGRANRESQSALYARHSSRSIRDAVTRCDYLKMPKSRAAVVISSIASVSTGFFFNAGELPLSAKTHAPIR